MEGSALVPLDDLTTRQMMRACLEMVTNLIGAVDELTRRMEHRMTTLEEATAALADAVDRIAGVITLVEQGRADAVAAAAAAQAALDAANAADAVEDADYQSQIQALKDALAAANDALNAQIVKADEASAAISAQVDELNALGTEPEPAPEPEPEPEPAPEPEPVPEPEPAPEEPPVP